MHKSCGCLDLEPAKLGSNPAWRLAHNSSSSLKKKKNKTAQKTIYPKTDISLGVSSIFKNFNPSASMIGLVLQKEPEFPGREVSDQCKDRKSI